MKRRNETARLLGCALAIAALTLGGCYWSGDDGDASEPQANVTLRLGDGGLDALFASPDDSITPMAGLPSEVARIHLLVTGDDFDDVDQDIDLPSEGEAVVVTLTLPPGTDRTFAVEAFGDFEFTTEREAGVFETETFERLAYVGETTVDLQSGPNEVNVEMDPRAQLFGRVMLIDPESPYLPTDPLGDFAATDGDVPIETDADGYYLVTLEFGTYTVEVRPGDLCPDDAIFDDCVAFGTVTLNRLGQAAVLNLFAVPDEAAGDDAPWASSFVSEPAAVGGQATVFGTHILGESEEFGPYVVFNYNVEDDIGWIFSDASDDWSESHVTVTVPDEATSGLVSIFSNVDQRNSNPIPVTIAE